MRLALQCIMLAFMNHELWDDWIWGIKVQRLEQLPDMGVGNVYSLALELEQVFRSPTTEPLDTHRMRYKGWNSYDSQDNRWANSPKSSLSRFW